MFFSNVHDVHLHEILKVMSPTSNFIEAEFYDANHKHLVQNAGIQIIIVSHLLISLRFFVDITRSHIYSIDHFP